MAGSTCSTAPRTPARRGRHEIDVAGTSAQLHEVVSAELQAGATDVRRTALERAVAILASPGDGEEVSDVAWPYFVLPDGASTGARRLIAAACATWPEIGGAPDPAAVPARGDAAVEAALRGHRGLGELGASSGAGRVAG